MNANQKAGLYIASLAVLCTVVGILTFMFGIYMLCGGGALTLLAGYRFLYLPSKRQQAEIDVRYADLRQIEAQTAQINLQNAIMQAEAQLRFARMPTKGFLLEADENGYYPALLSPDGRILAHPQARKALPAGYVDAEVEEEQDEIDEDAQNVAALQTPRKFLLSAQLQSGLTQSQEEQSIIGYDAADNPVRGRLFADEGNFFNSMFLFGDQGGGKTAFATLIAAYTVDHNGYLLVIDPDFETGSKQALLRRLGPLARKPFLLADAGIDPASAMRVLEIAEMEMQRPGNYPLAFLIDEATLLFRHAESGGIWQEVGEKLKSIAEDYATRGRKRRRRVVLMGQGPKAKRAGETDLRDNLDVCCFKMKRKKANVVFMKDDEVYGVEARQLAPSLVAGAAIVVPDGGDADLYGLQTPFADEDGLQCIADERMQRIRVIPAASFQPRRTDEDEERQTTAHPPMTPVADGYTDEQDFAVVKGRIREMLHRPKPPTESEMVFAIYNVKKSGAPYYAQCRDRVRAALEEIRRDEQREAILNGGNFYNEQ